MNAAAWPEIQTVAEQGYTQFGSVAWTGVFAPPATPAAIVNRLSTVFAEISKDPAIRKGLEPTGAIMVGSTPAQFRAFIAEEVTFTKNMVKELGIKPAL